MADVTLSVTQSVTAGVFAFMALQNGHSDEGFRVEINHETLPMTLVLSAIKRVDGRRKVARKEIHWRDLAYLRFPPGELVREHCSELVSTLRESGA